MIVVVQCHYVRMLAIELSSNKIQKLQRKKAEKMGDSHKLRRFEPNEEKREKKTRERNNKEQNIFERIVCRASLHW